MIPPRSVVFGFFPLLLLLSACGPVATPSSAPPTVSNSAARPSARPAATPAPSPPDIQRVDVVKSAFSAYELTTVPVALVHNVSAVSSAVQAVAHFTMRRANGSSLVTIDSPSLAIAPGQTTAAAAICIDQCVGAGRVDVAISVGSWGPGSAAVNLATAGAYHCGHCVAGAQFGDVSATLSSTAIAPGTPLHVTAICVDGGGIPFGGGTSQSVWPAGGTTLPVTSSVIVIATPAACTVYAVPGW